MGVSTPYQAVKPLKLRSGSNLTDPMYPRRCLDYLENIQYSVAREFVIAIVADYAFALACASTRCGL